ncbi:hypothetical protein ABIE06_001721 [Pantoea dispersa]|uniref:DNA polymerase V subunit n=1 Tax=Pantoea dispersa TaxID=59814 RepID=UPI003D1FCD2E
MLRNYEIITAFRQAVTRDAAGRYTISTLDFIREFDRMNWHYTLRAVNKWIEMYTTTFRCVMAWPLSTGLCGRTQVTPSCSMRLEFAISTG